MAKNFAVIENAKVINVIVADSKEIAESLTEKECIEYTEENPLGVDWFWHEDANKYVMPAPHASWVYSVEKNVWEAPIPMPVEEGKGFMWDEATTSWVSFDLPTV